MGLSVLCVDDDRNLCEILSKTLAGEGYEVRTAHDGEAALRRLQEGPADLVLLDLLLPKRDGFSVLEVLRAAPAPLSTTPVVLISGCSRTPQYVERANALGVAEFLTKPVPLEALLEVTAKHARRRRSVQKSGRPASGPAKPLSGELSDVAFPALLHHLHGLRANGVLRLESGKKKKAIALRDGRPVAVKSNLVNECLGNLLVRMQKISPEDMAESLRRVKRGEGLQGDVLVAMQLLSVEDVAEALVAQAEEKLFEVFEWPSGRFHWETGARLEGGNALALEKSAANMILDGVRRRVAIGQVDAFLEARAQLFVTQGESPFYRFQEIDLDPGEQLLLRALDGTMRLRDLGDQGESIRRTLYGLLVTEMLELRERASPSAARSAPLARLHLRRASPGRARERPGRERAAHRAGTNGRANAREELLRSPRCARVGLGRWRAAGVCRNGEEDPPRPLQQRERCGAAALGGDLRLGFEGARDALGVAPP